LPVFSVTLVMRDAGIVGLCTRLHRMNEKMAILITDDRRTVKKYHYQLLLQLAEARVVHRALMTHQCTLALHGENDEADKAAAIARALADVLDN
jgi:hypothetical protein